MKIWLKRNVAEVMHIGCALSYSKITVWLTILSSNPHDINSRLRAAMGDASSVTQLLMLSHKHLCAFFHAAAHIQEQLPVNINKTVSLSSFKSLFCHHPPLWEKPCSGWDSCGMLKSWHWPLLFHCALVPPYVSPPAASKLTHRCWILGKKLFAFCI